MKIKFNRLKFSAIIALAASFLCCVCVSAAGLFASPAKANAVGTAFTYSFGGDQSSRVTTVRNLITRVNGSSTTYGTYAEFSRAFTAARNAQQINANINLGGIQWQIVYAEKAAHSYGNTEKGDVVITLFMSSSASTQNAVSYSPFTSSDNTLAYPSGMYSSSYVRSVLTGSSYAASVADAQAGILTDGEQGSIWSAHESLYGRFLAVPANMGYQETESAKVQYNAAKNHENESWGTQTNSNTILNYGSKKSNTDWKYDKFWIPSRTETGGTSDTSAGLWNLSDSMRSSTVGGDFWQRTTTTAGNAHVLSYTGVTNSKATNVTGMIRPAMHLNLRLLYEDATTQVSELYNGSSVNQSALSDLLSALNSGNGGDYNALKAAVNARGGAMDYTQIKANNGGKTLTVTLGGRQWFVPYVSKDKTGNLIATLWLSGGSDSAPYFDKWASANSSGSIEVVGNSPRISYPANMYGTSYLRSFLVGSPFAAATGGTTDTDAAYGDYTKITGDGQLSLNYSGAQSGVWKTFLDSGVTDYLVKPKNVGWQEDEAYCIVHGSGTILCPNEELGIPAAGVHVGGMNYSDRYGYYDWGEDYIWIPSLYETKLDQRNDSAVTDKNSGLWAADLALTCPDGETGTWVRSANSLSANFGIYHTDTGMSYTARACYGEAKVRPALHFNLTKAAGGDPAEKALAELWNEAVQDSIDSGKQVEFILPENWYAFADEANGTSFGAGVGFKNGALCVPAGADIKLRLNGRVIDRNLASAHSGGGVIYVSGKLEVVDLTHAHSGKITGGNTTESGGGVCVTDGGEFTLTGGQITGNRSNSGGGVYAAGANSKVVISGGVISQNGVENLGGGLFIADGAHFELNGGTLMRNSAKTYGGAVFINGVSFRMSGGAVSENQAGYGGGIYINGGNGEGSKGTVELNGGFISANKVTNGGGGIVVEKCALTIDGCNIVGNQAGSSGGGLSVFAATARLVSGHIDDNTAVINGGGAFVDGIKVGSAEFIVDGGTVSGNNAASGGAIHIADGGSSVINNGDISNNNAHYGGALRVAGLGSARLTLNGGTVSNNTGVDGGALHINPDSNPDGVENFTMNGGEVINNVGEIGGAFLLCRHTIASINGGVISNNTAKVRGGSVYGVHSVELTITGGEIIDNRLTDDLSYGGGLCLIGQLWATETSHSAKLIMSGGLIAHNSAGSDGGGIYVNGAPFTMTGGEIIYNETRLNQNGGGGVRLAYKAEMTFSGGLVAHNTSGSSGGGISLTDATLNMSGGVITGNMAIENRDNPVNPGGGGGGVSLWESTFNMTGGEVSDNESGCYGGGVIISGGGTIFSTFNLQGGRIINNRTTGQRAGGGIAVSCSRVSGVFNGAPNVLNVSGGVVTGNTAMGGRVSNVYLDGTTSANRAKINIIGALADANGKTTCIGVTSAFSGVFTAGYSANNAGVNALTYFFSDDSSMGVAMSGNEAALSGSVDRKTLIWQYRENGGSWTNIESTQFTAEYTGGTFEVQAVYNGTVVISAPTSTSAAGGVASAFSGVGVYAFTLANAESGGVVFANPALIFEIVPASISWQIAVTKDIDGNAVNPVWEEAQGNALLFTGCEYTVRAVSGGHTVALEGSAVMLEAKDYEFKVVGADGGNYDGGTLNFKVNARYIGVNWIFDGFTGNAYAGYEKVYDGFGHSPIFTVNNIDNVTVGQLKVHKEYSYNGGVYTTAEPRNAGVYDVRLAFDGDSRFLKHLGKSIIFTGENARFKITPVSLRVEWRNGDGTPLSGDAEYVYNAAGQGLSFRLLTPMAGESVNGVVKYYYASGSPLNGAPVTPGEYLARADLPADCVNYVLADNYSHSLTITRATISPKFTGNADNGGAFVWYYNGKAQAPSVTLVGADGIALVAGVDYDITGDDNLNAADYVLSVALKTDAAELYILEDATRSFTIAKAPVDVEWSGYTERDGATEISGEKRVDGGIYWTYDKNAHGVKAVARPLNGLDEFELSLTDAGGLVNVGSRTATAGLGEFATNFEFTASAKRTQNFAVEKFIIGNVVWERDGKTYNSGDTPRFAFGKVTSEGPGFTVSAVGAAGETLSFTDKSFSWAASGEVYDLPENTVDGYTVTVTLADGNYAFAAGIASDTQRVKTQIKFFIDPVYAEVATVEVVWYTLDGEGNRVPLSDTPDNKFTFVYDGGEHEIYAWFYGEDGNWATGVAAFPDDRFDVIFTGDKKSAGTHVARITPRLGFEFHGSVECSYEITKKPLTIEWKADGKYVYGGSASEIIPHYTVKDGDKTLFVYDGTSLPNSGELFEAGFYVTGAYNAGPHEALTHISDNYSIINGTFGFTISPFELTGDIVWDNLEIIYTGGVAQPTAKIETPYDGDLVLRVLGGDSALGEHTAFAIIDSTGAGHNYVLSPSVDNEKTFVIILKKIDVNSVYWTAEDNADGDRITYGEYTFAFDGNGGAAAGLTQGPHAFFVDGDRAYKLEVVGHASNAGGYVAFVAAGYDFRNGEAQAAAPSCPFVIKPKTVTGAWSDTTAVYDGKVHKPKFTLAPTGNVLESEQLSGAIEVTGFENAGVYTASATLSEGYYRTNYVFDDGKGGACNTLSTPFTVNKFTVGSKYFAWNGEASWTYGDEVTPPELSATALSVEIDGEAVSFTFAYTGFSGYAGSHSVTARIASATLGGEDVSGNFALDIAAFAYVVNAKEVEIEWRWTGADESGDKPSFAYNGLARGPVVVMKVGSDYVTDENGEEITLKVHDLGTTVGGYTARVFAPDNYVFKGDKYSAEAEYVIVKAEITLVWDKNGGEEIFADDGVTLTGVKWTYDGQSHAPKAFVYDAEAENGRGGEVRVTGSSTDAGTFTAYAEGNNENYEISGGSSSLNCVIEAAVVYLVWRGNAEGGFEWQYDDGKEFAPTAVLATRDGETGDLTPIISGGDYLFATVTGAMGVVCGEGESYTATAVPDKKNYSFAADAEVTHEFRIVPKVLSGEGWEFEWKSETQPQLGGEYAVYGFVYNGTAQAPVPHVALGMLFVVEYYSVAEDGTLTPVSEYALTEAGRYRVTASSADGNYAVPADKATVEVVISPKTVKAVWSTEEIIYKGADVNQSPSAHFSDVNGNKIILNVLVDAAAYAEVGKYSATAAFVSPSANYVLDTDSTATEYSISPRKIPVAWDWTGWTDKSAEYDGKPHAPAATPSMDNAYEADLKGGLTVSSAITLGGKTVASAVNAGAYVITLTLGGSAAKNYSLTDDSAGFTITKRALIITAQSDTVAYGSPVPSYSATFSGWADGENENSFNLLNGAVKGNWISCAYNRRSQPGEYPIRLNRVWLESTLKNYKLTLTDGTLTVTAVDKTVIWRGELDDVGAYYSGAEYKPTAVYYPNGTTGAPARLQVVYAEYDEKTGVYKPLNDPDFKAVKAGTYHVIAVGGDASVELTNTGLTYEIHKRKITVNIESVSEEEFGSVYKVVDDGEETVRHKFLDWSYADGVRPVSGDDLGITLSCSFEFDAHGYAHAGEYKIVGDWNRAQYGFDYEVVFAGDGVDGDGNETCGTYEIVKAKISILKRDDIMSEGDFTYHIGNVSSGKAWYIRLGDYGTVDGVEQYLFIGSKGYRGRDNVKVEYSFKAYNMNELDPSVPLTPEEETNWITERVGLRLIGKYFIHYRITIENHETLLGTWRVLILPENEVVRIIFNKPYETEYGKPVPEDLAQYLYKEGYVTFDNIGVDAYNNRVTASVDDGYGGRVDSKTGVGKYTVNFKIDNTGSDIEYHIVYNTLQSLEETNVGAYVIAPKRIYIEWGETSYEYDGTLKAPSFVISGFITANNYTVTPDNLRFVTEGDGYEYTAIKVTDNGAEVTVIVAARGNFTAVGGHMLRLTVENSNYDIKTTDGETVVSIISPEIEPPVVDPTPAEGLPKWLIYVLIGTGCVIGLMFIIIIILAARKRKAAEYDDEGFGDYYDQ